MEVVRRSMFWMSSQIGCGCDGGRLRQDMNVLEVVTNSLWMWWRSSQTGCGCGGGSHRQAVGVVEVVTDRMLNVNEVVMYRLVDVVDVVRLWMWWRLSQTDVNVVEGRHSAE